MSVLCCLLMSTTAWASFAATTTAQSEAVRRLAERKDVEKMAGVEHAFVSTTATEAEAPKQPPVVTDRTAPIEDNAGVSLLTAWDATVGAPSGWRVFSEKPNAEGGPWHLGDDGILSCRGTPLGYLATRESYGDFVLRLQWRWPQGKEGKGGVLINLSGEDRIWPKSLEAQINAGQAGDFWGLAGFEFTGPAERLKTIDHAQFGRLTHLPRTTDAERPAGEWNEYEIRAEKESVVLRINGREVNRANRGAAVAGPIVLTAEGSPIEFRNIRVLVLDGAGRQRSPTK